MFIVVFPPAWACLNTFWAGTESGKGVYPQGHKIYWQSDRPSAQNHKVEIPEVWLQAQASVQAQLDQEALAEAADLAQAQWSDMTLATRLVEARGQRVDLMVAGLRTFGTLKEVSASEKFVLLECREGESQRPCEQLVRTSCINSARGLPRALAPASEALGRVRIGFREGGWLRRQWGNRVRIRVPGLEDAGVIVGRVAAVGYDFIEIDNNEVGNQRLVVALGSVVSIATAA